jgi:hypothetical protein
VISPVNLTFDYQVATLQVRKQQQTASGN